MSVRVVFLHGVGASPTTLAWLPALNANLVQLGADELDESSVCLPQYSDLLSTANIGAPLPPLTYKSVNEIAEGRAYELRQARLERWLKADAEASGMGWDVVPTSVVDFAVWAALGLKPAEVLDQAARYVTDDKLRGAVLKRVLVQFPSAGSVVVIGHSLGSLIAIDLLDQLPPDVHVKRLITMGSPAGSRTVHDKGERLLRKFPHMRVDDWVNFYGVGDVITGGRGLGAVFPEAHDVRLAIGASHEAVYYFQRPLVAEVVADARAPRSSDVVPASPLVEADADATEVLSLFGLTFAHHVAENIVDDEKQQRYRQALSVVQAEMAQELRERAEADGRPVSAAVAALVNAARPRLAHVSRLEDVLDVLVIGAMTNLVAPYEINASRAVEGAMRDMCVDLGLRGKWGLDVYQAVVAVKSVVRDVSGLRWPAIALGAAGVALSAAGPLGMALWTRDRRTDAAADMLHAPGALSDGSKFSAMAAALGQAESKASAATTPIAQLATDLVIRVAVEQARDNVPGVRRNDEAWFLLAEKERDIAAELRKLSTFSDPGGAGIGELKQKQELVKRLINYMIENGLGPDGSDA